MSVLFLVERKRSGAFVITKDGRDSLHLALLPTFRNPLVLQSLRSSPSRTYFLFPVDRLIGLFLLRLDKGDKEDFCGFSSRYRFKVVRPQSVICDPDRDTQKGKPPICVTVALRHAMGKPRNQELKNRS